MIERVSKAMSILAGLAALTVVLLVSFDVLMRYFFNHPQIFVDELASFLQVFITFGGLAYTFRTGGHVRVDLVISHVGPTARAWLRVITLGLGVAFLVVVIWVTAQSAVTAYRFGRVSVVMQYPIWVPMLFIPSGLALMAIAMAANLMRQVRAALGPADRREEI